MSRPSRHLTLWGGAKACVMCCALRDTKGIGVWRGCTMAPCCQLCPVSVMPCVMRSLTHALRSVRPWCLAVSHGLLSAMLCSQLCLCFAIACHVVLQHACHVVLQHANCVSCRFATRHALRLLCHSLSLFAVSLASIFTRVSHVCILIYTHTHLCMDVFVCAHMHVRVCVCVCSYKERERETETEQEKERERERVRDRERE